MVLNDRFAGRIVLAAAVLSIAPFALIGWAVWDLHRLVPEVRQRSLAAQELIGRIDYLDEALTSSARLGAATGDGQWEARYRALDAELTAVLDSLGEIARAVDRPAFGASLAVGDSLTALEELAFELVRSGDADSASALLESGDYDAAKESYQRRKGILVAELEEWVLETERRTDGALQTILVLAAASFLILLFVWSTSVHLVRREMRRRHGVEGELRGRVAEQERLESEVRKAEDRLRVIVDVAPVAIMRVDRDRIVQYWNPAAEEIFGWSAAEVVGRPYPLAMREDEPEAQRLFERGFAGEPLDGIELRRERKDGSEVLVQMWNAVVRSADGEVQALVGVFADVTEQRALERRLRQSERLEAIGQLAGGIAHDFNNVMTVVQGHADLLLEAVAVDDSLRHDIEEIRRSAGRATDLTRQLLAFSRRQVLKPRVLALGGVVRGLEPMLRRLLGEHVRLAIDAPDELGHVEADPTQVEQVIVNLAVNARDAMPQGGRLTIRLEETRITSQEADAFEYEVIPGPYVRLVARDTGVGMDESTRQRVFEPFFTTKNSYGTGLGLATVFGIVKQSGGYVWVHSEPGQGTEFEVLLPRVDKALPPAPPAETPAAGAGSADEEEETGETILLVEDDDAVRAIARRVLDARGYRVFAAGGPADALARVADENAPPIDLLVTDVVMPEMDGPELARQIAASVPGIRVVLMSGYTEDEVVRNRIAGGATHFLAKPFTPNDLTAAVARALRSDPGER